MQNNHVLALDSLFFIFFVMTFFSASSQHDIKRKNNGKSTQKHLVIYLCPLETQLSANNL